MVKIEESEYAELKQKAKSLADIIAHREKKLDHRVNAEVQRLQKELDTVKENARKVLNAETQRLQGMLDKANADAKTAAEAALKRIAELTAANSALTAERNAAIAKANEVCQRFDPQIKAAEREQKAKELEQLKAKAALLEKELA